MAKTHIKLKQNHKVIKEVRVITNQEKLSFIEDNYLKIPTDTIAKETNLSKRQVWLRAEKMNLVSKNQQGFKINNIQHQIIISGVLGDGNLKKNGKNNYQYRECHSIKEQDYMMWKYEQLDTLTNGMKISYVDARKDTQNEQIRIHTITTPSLIKYAKMSKSDIINELDELGLLLYLMDDGWHRKYSDTTGSLSLAVHGLNFDEKELLLKAFKDVLCVQGNLIGKDKDTISFKSIDLCIFFDLAKKYLSTNMDVVQKKFSVLL